MNIKEEVRAWDERHGKKNILLKQDDEKKSRKKECCSPLVGVECKDEHVGLAQTSEEDNKAQVAIVASGFSKSNPPDEESLQFEIVNNNGPKFDEQISEDKDDFLLK